MAINLAVQGLVACTLDLAQLQYIRRMTYEDSWTSHSNTFLADVVPPDTRGQHRWRDALTHNCLYTLGSFHYEVFVVDLIMMYRL